MKLNKYIGIAVMPLLFAACQNDEMDDMQQNQPIYTLSGIMDKGVNSRAQIQLGNPDESGEIFMWNEGDCFNLYQGGPETEVTFNISSSYTGNQSSATFSSENPVYPGTYVAVYPQVEFDEENRFIFNLQTELDFSNAITQEAKDAVWKEYFKNNMFMIAKGELNEEGTNSLQFEQQCALMRITYRNESGSDQVLNHIRLGGNQYYGFYRHQNMDLMGSMGGITSWYQVNFNGLQVAAGESTDIYVLFFGYNFEENGNIEIYFSVQGGDRSVSLPVSELAAANNGASGFEAGMRYWFDVTATKGGAVLSKNYSTKPIVFEDPEFAKVLQGVLGSDMVTIDEEKGYATMMEGDVLNIYELNFNYYPEPITSLAGIEKFENLRTFNCIESNLTECDLSQNKLLENLRLDSNKLTKIDLSKNTNLKLLQISNNQELSSVNLSNCFSIQFIDVSNTGLTSMSIPFKGLIRYLNYGNTKLSFELDQFPALTSLGIQYLGLHSLDMIPSSVKAQLIELVCHNNSIESIDLNEFPRLEYLHISENNLTTLDLTPTSNMHWLYCDRNYMDRLDISSLNDIYTLNCGNQKDDISLTLIANDNQKYRWRTDWCNYSANQNAYLEGEKPVEVPEGNGNGNDFETGGEF